ILTSFTTLLVNHHCMKLKSIESTHFRLVLEAFWTKTCGAVRINFELQGQLS
ncbi:hypothetical protein Ocin01_12071, partial [Orchesella cincta]